MKVYRQDIPSSESTENILESSTTLKYAVPGTSYGARPDNNNRISVLRDINYGT